MPEEKLHFQSGALDDPRSEQEILEQDIRFEEIVAAAAPVDWKKVPRSQYPNWPVFNQNGSGSCVAQTLGKMMGVHYALANKQDYVHYSATHIYQRRYNKPAPGMAAIDAFRIAAQGVTLEELVPSQNMTDAEMDAIQIQKYKEDVGSVFKIGPLISLPVGDIEKVASVIQVTGKPVMTWFFFEYNEWTERPTIKYPNLTRDKATCRHSVPSLIPTLLDVNSKGLVIQDSWGDLGGELRGKREITEEFFVKRNYFSGYFMNFTFQDQTQPTPSPEPTPGKPRYKFTKELTMGMRNADVVALQNIMKYEGCFPENTASTGLYGAVTREAVLKLQIKNKIAPLAELQTVNGKRVGPKTIAWLNANYS